MAGFLLTIVIIMFTLGVISYVASKRGRASDASSALTLLPGDIKYESPSGNFRFYFPVTTSIVISVILTLVLYFLR